MPRPRGQRSMRGKELRGYDASLRTPFVAVEPAADLVEFVGEAHAVYAIKARRGQSESRRKAQPHAFGQLPTNQGWSVLRGVPQRQRPCIAQAAVSFDSGYELFRTEGTGPATGSCAQWTRRSDRITELPRGVAQIFLGDEVFRNVPGLEVQGEDQPCLSFMLMLLPGLGVGLRKVGLPVMCHHFEQRLVGAGDVFILDVE